MMPGIVGEVMTREVVRARPETPFKEVARLLDRHRISGLPVVDHDDKVVGVVSETDLIRHQAAPSAGSRAPRLPRPAAGYPAGAGVTTAGDLMSTPAITVHPEQQVANAARVMERHSVGRLPVVDEEDRLIGITTRRDLLRVFLRTDEEIRRDVVADALSRGLGPAANAVTVSVRDGMVTLEGCLEHRSDIPVAIQMTYRVDGVVGVVASLTCRRDDARGPSGPGEGTARPS
ncbi:CBS domain-containing protein [Streptomyces shenzhenensis]|uniref:CBS domain-containing protein n=1 Tax=Streptomyces shenzhenensis TaxID=943815 RepID=UPI0035582D6D